MSTGFYWDPRRSPDLWTREGASARPQIEELGADIWAGGKTHLAIGLGQAACRKGYRVQFFTAAGLATTYAEAREERHLQKLERAIDKRDPIIVDELGYVPLGQALVQ